MSLFRAAEGFSFPKSDHHFHPAENLQVGQKFYVENWGMRTIVTVRKTDDVVSVTDETGVVHHFGKTQPILLADRVR